jgi:hypothetical protein
VEASPTIGPEVFVKLSFEMPRLRPGHQTFKPCLPTLSSATSSPFAPLSYPSSPRPHLCLASSRCLPPPLRVVGREERQTDRGEGFGHRRSFHALPLISSVSTVVADTRLQVRSGESPPFPPLPSPQTSLPLISGSCSPAR